jgi:hypothetical protein
MTKFAVGITAQKTGFTRSGNVLKVVQDTIDAHN